MSSAGQKAILVTSFGTSHRETCEKNIGAIEAEIARAFPDWTVHRAFTSGMIIRKLRERDNLTVDHVEEALDRLSTQGVDTVVCQPTHVINGEEYDGLVAAAQSRRALFRKLAIGRPLLSDSADYSRLASVLGKELAPHEDEALCLMGHGTAHPADCAYAALDYHFKNLGYSRAFVGTVEGFPDLQTLLKQLRLLNLPKAVLAPLMVVAGDHAVNDLAGENEDSWRSALESAGYEVRCILKGLGEYSAVRAMYVEHLRLAMDALR